jgi:serine/threonine protein kinase
MRSSSSFKNSTTFIEDIGHGSQGKVEKHVKNTGEIVAIKKFFPDSQGDIDSATLRELNIFQKLKNCPTINQSLDIDIIINKNIDISIMMPFHQYNLTTIGELLPIKNKINQLPLIMNQLFNALHNLYYIGVIHADIKPDNILVDVIDGKMKLYLADFGLAIQVPCEFTYRYTKKPIHGSPLYMAPELLTGNRYYDEKIDIWSTGITILDFITEKYTTDPGDQLMDMADDDAFVAIIYKLLELANKPLYPTIQLYDDIKNYQYHDGIDVDNILKLTLSDENYNLIPKTIIEALKLMLQINPKDRVSIRELYTGKVCAISSIIGRGAMIDQLPLDEFYDTIFTIIKCCDNLDVSPTTCYLTIDIFERYIANFNIKSVKKLHTYAAGAIVLNHKLYEKHEIDFRSIILAFNNEFTYNDLLYAELFMLKKFNYLLTTCETDEMINAINVSTTKSLKMYNFAQILKNIKMKGDLLEDFKISVVNRKMIYPTLLNMYKHIENENLYSGEMFPFELVEVFDSF